ncbi:MAG: LysR family transcriptional regulator [Pseudomonadota bacterium]
MDWNDLRFVLAVADEGSANAAAKKLGVNHATVLRRIDRFEMSASLRIFIRSPTGYRIDPSALPVLEALRTVGVSVEKLARVSKGESERVSGPVRITTTDSLALSVMPRLLAKFRVAHPNIAITLLSTNALLNLARSDADLTVRPGQSMPEGIVSARAATMSLRVYGAPTYIEQLRTGEAPNWLGVSELLSRSPAFAWQSNLPPDRIVLRADSFVTIAALAREGAGLAMLPDMLAHGLAPAAEYGEKLDVGIWVGVHTDLIDVPRVALCRRWFIEALATEPSFSG